MKTLLSFLLTIALSNLVIGQTTAVPDVNFEQALINLGYDFGTPDGSVITANIDTVATLNIMNNNISDLTGIEDFAALNHLNCYGNLLTSINVTQNSALNILRCTYNQLTSLNVTQNVDLTELSCAANQLTNLDVTQNSDLTFLNCANNLLTSLDVTQNNLIDTLYCELNQLTSLNVTQNTDLIVLFCFTNVVLTSLDVSQNILLTKLYCEENALTCLNLKNGNNTNLNNNFAASNNPNLTCIEVDDVAWSNANWFGIDAQTSFSTNCNNACTACTPTSSIITAEGLDSYTSPSGDVYTTEGVYTDTIQNAAGCDSIITIDLSMNFTGIGELNNTPKQLIKIVDVLGRETPFKPNTPLLYIYNDGTVERKVVLK